MQRAKLKKIDANSPKRRSYMIREFTDLTRDRRSTLDRNPKRIARISALEAIPELATWMNAPSDTITAFTLHVRGELNSVMMCTHTPAGYDISYIYTAPDARRRGLATQLIYHAARLRSVRAVAFGNNSLWIRGGLQPIPGGTHYGTRDLVDAAAVP